MNDERGSRFVGYWVLGNSGEHRWISIWVAVVFFFFKLQVVILLIWCCSCAVLCLIWCGVSTVMVLFLMFFNFLGKMCFNVKLGSNFCVYIFFINGNGNGAIVHLTNLNNKETLALIWCFNC